MRSPFFLVNDAERVVTLIRKKLSELLNVKAPPLPIPWGTRS